MAEYVDREALKNDIAKSTEPFNTGSVFRAINRQIVAEVAPVRHGRWVDNHCTACGMMPMGDEMWEICDFEPPRFEKFMDYCPSCGAKMDGGNNDDSV